MDTLSPKQRSKIMSLVRGKNTKPELAVRKLLSGLGYRYSLHSRKLPGQPDIVFTSRKRAIFVHGCFWHGHKCSKGRLPKSRVRFWREKIERNARRDRTTKQKLSRMGWKSLTIWECNLRKNILPKVEDRLTTFLKINN